MLKKVYDILLKEYGQQGWWPLRSKKNTGFFNSGGYHPRIYPELNINDKFEIAVGAILTQNTNWKNASRAIDNLLEHNMLNFVKIVEAPVEKIAKLIKSSGYYNQKAKKLKSLSLFFVTLNNVPKRKELLSLWGVGDETADSIMLYAFNQPYFIIDLYTRRILYRLSGDDKILTVNYKTLQAEIQEKNCFDLVEMKEFHALLVFHAKSYCSKSALCVGCPLGYICIFAKHY